MPALVCVAATVIADVERIARDYQEFRRDLEKLNVKILVGGRAFAAETTRRRFPADLRAENFQQLSEYVEKFSPQQS